MGKLDGKVAVITGSTRGLGLGIAQAYAAEGATVVISSRTTAAVERVVADFQAAGYQASGLACDVGNRAEVEALAQHAIERWGHFDIWVNNAGLSSPYGPTIEVPPADFEVVLDTNIRGTYYGSRAALLHFTARGSGKLINLLGRGDDKPVPFQNAYASSKAWIASFTAALAKENARQAGIGVFAFNPGLVDTDMLRSPKAISGWEQRLNPLKTVIRMWANPAEVPAERAVWLVSAATDGKTGLVNKVLGPGRLVRGLLNEVGRRLTGRGEKVELDIHSVPSGRPV